jgi:drug/metabolite transporter (DMT)-like permease
MTIRTSDRGVLLALGAAALYALSVPFGKRLLEFLSPALLAGLLYLGAGVGMTFLRIGARKHREAQEIPLSKKDLPNAVGMILLDILAPILLMLGLKSTGPETTSLLNNFEIVATALFALFFFGESISSKLWLGIIFIFAASVLLTFENPENLTFSGGAILVWLATICWGLENNLTRKMSTKDPSQIVVLKGWFSGIGSILVAWISQTLVWDLVPSLLALLLGFVAYGLSIFLYVHAQRRLGAAKTSVFYAVAPFLAAGLSFLLYPSFPEWTFFTALGFMAIGAWLSARSNPSRKENPEESNG